MNVMERVIRDLNKQCEIYFIKDVVKMAVNEVTTAKVRKFAFFINTHVLCFTQNISLFIYHPTVLHVKYKNLRVFCNSCSHI